MKKYLSDGESIVFANKKIIALSYITENSCGVLLLQGVNRSEVMKKISEDCPKFLEFNKTPPNVEPRLFGKLSKQKEKDLYTFYKSKLV